MNAVADSEANGELNQVGAAAAVFLHEAKPRRNKA